MWGVGKLALAAWAAVLLAMFSGPASLAAGAPGDFTAIDAYVQGQLDDAHLPGLALGIVHGDQVAHVRGFGHLAARLGTITPQTPFIIGSVSKSFTALAVMQLVEAGKVDLERPARDYVPDFRLADAAEADRITVRQLLNQTSGIPTEAGIDPLTDRPTSIDGQVRRLAGVKPRSMPGAAYAYSNSKYEVLGRLVELVSGQEFGAYLADHALRPLEMTHTHPLAQRQRGRVPLDGADAPSAAVGIVVLANAESLLYTMLGRLDVIADGVAAKLVDGPQPGTLAGLYIAFDVVVVLITLLQVRTLVRLARRPPGLPAGKGRLRLVVFELVLPVWRELIAPVALLVGLPAALSAPWVNLAGTDIGAWVLLLGLLLLATGAVRVYRVGPDVLAAARRALGPGSAALQARSIRP